MSIPEEIKMKVDIRMELKYSEITEINEVYNLNLTVSSWWTKLCKVLFLEKIAHIGFYSYSISKGIQ